MNVEPDREDAPSLGSLYDQTAETWYGRLLRTEDAKVYVECGRQQRFPVGQAMLFQVTVRDITLDETLRKRGMFTRFVEHLLDLPNIEAVRLEAVQPDWLNARLDASPLWQRQQNADNWARTSNEKPFRLF